MSLHPLAHDLSAQDVLHAAQYKRRREDGRVIFVESKHVARPSSYRAGAYGFETEDAIVVAQGCHQTAAATRAEEQIEMKSGGNRCRADLLHKGRVRGQVIPRSRVLWQAIRVLRHVDPGKGR